MINGLFARASFNVIVAKKDSFVAYCMIHTVHVHRARLVEHYIMT